jgi:uncharacterized cupin superfamily protein
VAGIPPAASRLPTEGLELMWQFLELAESIFARCDDSSGTVIDIFHSAVADLGAIAQSARHSAEELADQASNALVRNGYGQFDDLIQALVRRAMSMRSSRSMRSLSGGPQRSPPRLHGDCSQRAGSTKPGRPSRGPILGEAAGLISNGKMPGSMSWRPETALHATESRRSSTRKQTTEGMTGRRGRSQERCRTSRHAAPDQRSSSLAARRVARLELERPVCQTGCISAAYEEATMARGSKVFRPADVSESNASSYPEPFREGQRKRYTRRLGDHAGLKNYGVNLVRVLPDGQSSARHTHSQQDEFIYVLEGEFVLVTDAGRETVGPGTCIGFPAGTGDGHHFLNLTQKDAMFLVIGDRTAGDEVTYPDIDLELKAGPDGVRGFRRKDGTPYPRAARD